MNVLRLWGKYTNIRIRANSSGREHAGMILRRAHKHKDSREQFERGTYTVILQRAHKYKPICEQVEMGACEAVPRRVHKYKASREQFETSACASSSATAIEKKRSKDLPAGGSFDVQRGKERRRTSPRSEEYLKFCRMCGIIVLRKCQKCVERHARHFLRWYMISPPEVRRRR